MSNRGGTLNQKVEEKRHKKNFPVVITLPCADRYENITPQALVEKLSASVPCLSIVVAKQFGSEGNSFVIGLLFQSISIYSAQKEIRGVFAGASITIKYTFLRE
jgi:hypothetical protein